MLLSNMIESKQDTVKLNDIDVNALEQLINYSYTGDIQITNENAQSILIGAIYLQLQNITTECVKFIKTRFSLDDALVMKQFAERFMLNDLIATANRVINKNFIKICETEEFLHSSYNVIDDLLSRDQLNVESEEQVFSALCS